MRTILNAPRTRAAVLALLATGLLAGCETFGESYLIEQQVIIDEQGVQVTSDLEEDFLGGNRWFQFRAFNSNDFDVCVRVSLLDGSYTSGHSLGGVHRVAPSQLTDVGYITAPADFRVNTEVSSPGDDGQCS